MMPPLPTTPPTATSMPVGPVMPGTPNDGPYLERVDGAVPSYVLGGVTKEGLLVVMYSDGATEVLCLVDPKSGRQSSVTRLGILKSWDYQLVYDPESRFA